MLTRIERPVVGAEAFALRLIATVQLYGESWKTMRSERTCGIVFGLRMLGLQAVAVDVQSPREVA